LGRDWYSLDVAPSIFCLTEWTEYFGAKMAARGARRAGYFTTGDGEPIVGEAKAAEIRRDNARIDHLEKAHRRLVEALLERLQLGELEATGYRAPVGSHPTREPIATDLWTFLVPNLTDSSAQGEGLRFAGIQVAEAEVAESSQTVQSSAEDWISARVAEGSVWKKREAFDAARKAIGDSLSRRAFDRAWATIAPNAWKRPGFKGKKRSGNRRTRS
jgi:hypothetical protein